MQYSKTTLVILSPGFPESEADTTCLPAQQQFVLSLREHFPMLNIIILAFQYPFKETTYHWNNITVHSFNGRNQGKQQRLLLWIRVWRKLAALHKQYTITGLLSFWYGDCALVAKSFALRHKLKRFTWILGQDARENNNYVRWARLREHELIALSDFIADTFEHNYKLRPQHTIPLGIDPRILTPSGNPRIIDVMGAGSLIPLKQYNVFIDIIGAAINQFPDIKAVICGKGPEHQKLQKQVANLNLSNNVSLQGETPYAQVLTLMQRSRIFLHTSSYEGFGMVCLEALYAGAHVISFCQPVKQNIPHWHIVNNQEEMLQKLVELLKAPALDHQPVMPFSTKDTAHAVMSLFGG